MSKYSIEKNTLVNIANAVREKEGSTGSINVTDLASRISAIDTQENLDEELTTQDALISEIQMVLENKANPAPIESVIEPLSVTENGTYTAPSGIDGYSPVEVNVQTGVTPTSYTMVATGNDTYTLDFPIDNREAFDACYNNGQFYLTIVPDNPSYDYVDYNMVYTYIANVNDLWTAKGAVMINSDSSQTIVFFNCPMSQAPYASDNTFTIRIANQPGALYMTFDANLTYHCTIVKL